LFFVAVTSLVLFAGLGLVTKESPFLFTRNEKRKLTIANPLPQSQEEHFTFQQFLIKKSVMNKLLSVAISIIDLM
jgi:hypothetical protein